ncbi:aldo/keto reductase [Tolypothrix sp. PCC 7910]|uniref:aldo/keto reductase n=1 Tax=Tolypothrix sp. PCC 7910 TaxID=2099387 RepID=UPI000D204E8F|nr:aldo/keto reductase [Tolypothrix sp. PCC 7910]AVH79438.1 oxidoreductase of the aldo/keto reductase family-like protein [Tolypothrix sp. PCC 7910]QIR37104.1 aldo/keto reductase [Tolypothrix sp. PCC 7910]
MLITDLASQLVVETNQNPCPNPPFPESDLPFYRQLGRTDLTVSCLGLGGGGSISSEDTLYAFDQGINYFFYSSDLHHYIYSSMAGALRQLCGRSSAMREQVVLATVTYIKNPEMAIASLFDQFVDLQIDYIDVFFWGWIGVKDGSALQDCLQLSPDLRGPNSVYQRSIEKMLGISERLKKMGAVRYIGASFHDINLAQQWSNSPLLDVVMLRHNIAHRSAQRQIFNQLDSQNPHRPGIVTFKSTGSHTGVLWDAPQDLPTGCWKPLVPDLYRYSLSQNCVDVCLTGWRYRQEIDAAIAAIQKGKLSPAEINYLNIYGDLHRNKLSLADISPENLIYRS